MGLIISIVIAGVTCVAACVVCARINDLSYTTLNEDIEKEIGHALISDEQV